MGVNPTLSGHARLRAGDSCSIQPHTWSQSSTSTESKQGTGPARQELWHWLKQRWLKKRWLEKRWPRGGEAAPYNHCLQVWIGISSSALTIQIKSRDTAEVHQRGSSLLPPLERAGAVKKRARPFREGSMTHCSGQDLLPCKNVRFLETWNPFQNNHKKHVTNF